MLKNILMADFPILLIPWEVDVIIVNRMFTLHAHMHGMGNWSCHWADGSMYVLTLYFCETRDSGICTLLWL